MYANCKFPSLVELCCKEIKAGDDAAVGAELVLLHDLLVVDGVPNVNVGGKGNLATRRIKVDNIRRYLQK